MTTDIDLAIDFLESPAGIITQIEYNTDLFDDERVGRMLDHFETLVQGVVRDPQQAISQLPLLSAAERQQVLETWNATTTAYPHTACVHELFEAQVQRTPQAIALVAGAERLTYGELDERANQLAHYLQAAGVTGEVLVGIAMERGIDQVVALLAVLKAGGAYVPLDPDYPPSRLTLLLDDTRVPLVLTHQALRQRLPTSGAVRIIALDDPDVVAAFARQPRSKPLTRVTADNLIYVMYTSGSTGRPKGVMIEHRNVCNHLIWMIEALQITATDRTVYKYSLTFDPSVCEIFVPLLTGAQLFLIESNKQSDISYLASVIGDNHITVLDVTPSVLEALLNEPAFLQCTNLKRVLCGGETLTTALVQDYFSTMSAALYNVYGPTETTIGATCWKCTSADQQSSIPIGQPIANTRVYILDGFRQPVPIGVAGELYVGGDGVGRGYLGLPALTGERFMADPFVPGGQLYRTGDRARHRADGQIEFLGRTDQQVKIRGYRVEPGEVEAVLGQHPAVGAVAVVARRGEPQGLHLVAYVVGRDGVLGPSELRQYLAERLPAFMIPAQFVLMEALPLTASGKVDRALLPARDDQRPALAMPYAQPQSALEDRLAAVWRQLLGLSQAGIHDNFFDLGGHSLLIVRMQQELQMTLGVQASLVELFEFPTIHGLAQHLEARGLSATPSTARVQPAPSPILAGSPGQVNRLTE